MADVEKTQARWRAASRRYRAAHLERVRANERASAKRNYAKNKPRIKAHNRLRRAREKGAPRTEVIHLHVLAERDGWRCHLCGGRVTKKTWSMDHLVPLSRGGDHTYDNVALAHRLCNVRRQVDRAPAQLRLIA